jgi:hypothetical protein
MWLHVVVRVCMISVCLCVVNAPASPSILSTTKHPPRPKKTASIPNPAALTTRDLPIEFVILQDRDAALASTPKNRPPPPPPLKGAHFITRPQVIMDPSPYQIADGTLLSKVRFGERERGRRWCR